MKKQTKPIVSDTSRVTECPANACINPEVAEVLNDMPKAKREIVLQAINQESFSGPIPHPKLLQGYENVQVGFAERIVCMAEKQQEHRCECEDKIIKGSIAESKRGQNYGLIISLLFLGASVFLGYLGHDWLAGVLGGGTLISLVTIFVKGRSNKEQSSNDSNGLSPNE